MLLEGCATVRVCVEGRVLSEDVCEAECSGRGSLVGKVSVRGVQWAGGGAPWTDGWR